MPINPEIPEEVPEEKRTEVRELDIINTQIHPQWEEGNVVAEGESSDLIMEVDDFLDRSGGKVESEEELDKLLKKINTAIAINNEPYARELRARLLKRSGERK